MSYPPQRRAGTGVQSRDPEPPSSLDGVRAQLFDSSGLLRAFRAIQSRAKELSMDPPGESPKVADPAKEPT